MESPEGASDRPRPTEDDGAALEKAAFQRFEEVARDPERSDVLDNVLATHLTGEISERTLRLVQKAAELYVGSRGFAAIAAIASQPDYADELASMDLSGEGKRWLERLLALHGPRL